MKRKLTLGSWKLDHDNLLEVNKMEAGKENAWLDPLSSAEVTNGHFSSEPFQDYADLVLPDESPGLLTRGLCGLALIDVVLRHFWLLS